MTHWTTLRGSMLAFLVLASCAPTELSSRGNPGEGRPASAARALLDDSWYVSADEAPDRFALSAAGRTAPLVVAATDYPGVIRAATNLGVDLGRVTGVAPEVLTDQTPAAGGMVLIGTLGKSPLLDQLVSDGKIDVTDIAGRWESWLLEAVDAPLPGVDRALVIAGSDKRGTIYGIYDLSAQIGVSPWYWWADVPVPEQSTLYVLPGRHGEGEPAVKYRGLFINDENPSLLGWVNQKFGGFKQPFYEEVFELMLRLRANYLWPAQWGKAFNDDDASNPQLADEYGIVMGTAHNEPMMRAEDEWRRYGWGAWDYLTNTEFLREYWAQGIRRMGTYESIVTIGMRGQGDARLSPNPDIPLVETVVADQRQILADVTGRDPTTIPQVWTLYKEVQDYYDQGMRVPDDVTLILADDNFGNIRKLPQLEDPPRPGGFGIYYHYDYVGSPRSYKWLNTNPSTGHFSGFQA
jgi:hypothetical protein